jgi:hypothetical protein
MEPPQQKGSVDMSEHDEIIAEAREKYTVHNCGQCKFRKSCNLGINCFDSDECRERRQSIMLGFGIEDGYFTKLLDRLGAAHKREIEASRANSEKSSAVGNAAKMRSALKYLRDASREFCHLILNSKYNQIYDKYKCKEFVKIGDAIVYANIALAASPRNCERFADELDAQIEFLNDVWLISVTKDTMLERDKFENWTEEMKSRYASWLFAEAKGENK